MRPWDPASDQESWHRWRNDLEVARWLGPYPERSASLVYYDFCIEREEDGAPLGRLLLTDPSEDGRAELVIAIGRDEDRGLRYGREAIDQAMRFAFETLGVSEVYLRVGPENGRAVRCYLASGFVKEGILRRSGSDRVLLMSRRRHVG